MVKSIEFKKASIVDARREIEGELKQPDERLWRYPRHAHQENNVLQNATLTWMARLPKDVRAMVLAPTFSKDCEHHCGVVGPRGALRRIFQRAGNR